MQERYGGKAKPVHFRIALEGSFAHHPYWDTSGVADRRSHAIAALSVAAGYRSFTSGMQSGSQYINVAFQPLRRLWKQRSANRKREGFFFTYQLTPMHFGLNLLRVIPLARVRLDQVHYIRTRSGERLAGLLAELLAHPFKCRYWPHPIMKTAPWQSTPFVIRLYSGRRVFVRLRPGFHYTLRAAVGEARAKDTDAADWTTPASGAPID